MSLYRIGANDALRENARLAQQDRGGASLVIIGGILALIFVPPLLKKG